MNSTKSSPTHWADQRERGSLFLMRLMIGAARHLGRKVIAPIVWCVVLYFYITGRQARRCITRYQHHLRTTHPSVELPKHAPVYHQFLAFSESLLDKFDVWQNKITIDDIDLIDPDGLHDEMKCGKGQMLVGSHLGNIEICRALAERENKLVLNVLVHNKHAQAFNHLLGETGPVELRLIQVSELDAPRMMALAQSLEQGEWIAIMGDRIPLSSDRTVDVNFLGASASLPQGPWLLAGLLGCPVNLLDCTRHHGKYRVALKRLTPRIEWTRSTRAQEIARWAQAYADHLAIGCTQAPLQWFNFYPFWKNDA